MKVFSVNPHLKLLPCHLKLCGASNPLFVLIFLETGFRVAGKTHLGWWFTCGFVLGLSFGPQSPDLPTAHPHIQVCHPDPHAVRNAAALRSARAECVHSQPHGRKSAFAPPVPHPRAWQRSRGSLPCRLSPRVILRRLLPDAPRRRCGMAHTPRQPRDGSQHAQHPWPLTQRPTPFVQPRSPCHDLGHRTGSP